MSANSINPGLPAAFDRRLFGSRADASPFFSANRAPFPRTVARPFRIPQVQSTLDVLAAVHL